MKSYTVMTTAILVMVSAATASSVFATTSPGSSFKFDSANQKFSLEIDTTLNEQVTLDDARKMLGNPDSVVSVSEVIKSATLKAGKTPNSSTLYSSLVRYHIQRNLVSDCIETNDANHWNLSCTLRITQDPADSDDRGQTQLVFNSGGTNFDCAQASSHASVKCQIKIWGQAKEQHFAFIHKSGASLGLDGSGLNLHDFGLIMEALNDRRSARDEVTAYPNSHLQELVSALSEQTNPLINKVPSGKILEASGDFRVGEASFKVGIR